MIKNDYILRIVEQFVQALARIMGLKRSGHLDEAEEEIATASMSIIGLTPEALVLLPLGSILQMLRGGEGRGQTVEVERGAIVARLIKEHGDILEARGEPERARAAWIKAFVLYDELGKHASGDQLDAHQETISWLTERL